MDDEQALELHDWHRRHQPPPNEIPVAVPLQVRLARTPDVAVALVGAQVHTTGVLLHLRTVVRPGAELDLARLHTVPHADPGAELVGVELADGRRASTVLDWRGTGSVDEPVLDARGGGGGPHEREQTYWLAPVPPAGPLTLVYLCAGLGVDEVSVQLDATPLAEAAVVVEQLWPWEPEQHDDPSPPAPPDLPEDSWFAADVRRWTTG